MEAMEPMSAVVCVVVWRWRGEAGLCASLRSSACCKVVLSAANCHNLCGAATRNIILRWHITDNHPHLLQMILYWVVLEA